MAVKGQVGAGIGGVFPVKHPRAARVRAATCPPGSLPVMPQYTYRLRLDPDESGPTVAAFRYMEAPAPHDDDTALQLNGPSWVAMGSPEVVEVTIVPVSAVETRPGR